MDSILQTLQNLTRMMEGQHTQIQTMSIQVATLTTALDHSTAEIRRCLDHHDERIADHEIRLREMKLEEPWKGEIESLRKEMSGLYVSVNELEACRDKGVGGKEYLAYLVGVVGGLVGVYSMFVK